MDHYSINMPMYMACLILLLTLIFSQILRKAEDRINRLFLHTLILLAAADFFDLIWTVCNHAEIYGYFFIAVRFSALLCGCIFHPFLFLYLLHDEKNEERPYDAAHGIIVTLLFLSILCMVLEAAVLIAEAAGIMDVHTAEIHCIDIFKNITLIQYLCALVFTASRSGDYPAQRKKIIAFIAILTAAQIIDFYDPYLKISNAFLVFALMSVYLDFQLYAEKKMESTELELLNTRISLILGKIRPDFVFENLEAIEEMCRTDAEEAQEAIALFSEYLRGNIDGIDTNRIIRFEDELEHIENYVDLLRLRDDSVQLHCDLGIKGFFIPARTIYPYIEILAENGKLRQLEKTEITVMTRGDGPNASVEIIGPARLESFDTQAAMEHYELITSRLAMRKGTSIAVYTDLNQRMHARFIYPLTAREADA